MRQRRGLPIAAALAVASGCGFSPLSNHIKVGQEDIVVFVGEGITGSTDLFVSSAAGGTPTQLTFTVAAEVRPRITPDGGMLAFVRARDTAATTTPTLVVMNLVNASERSVELPDTAGAVINIGWSNDLQTIHVRTVKGNWKVTAPPTPMSVTPVPGADAAADSALQVWLGEPRFARAIGCVDGVCVIGASGDTASLAAHGRDPMRWGTDSVAWFENDDLIVRGLGPGPARRVTWRKAPANPRDATYSRASAVTADST